MIDHISLPVRDYERSKQFYQAALAPLGYRVLMQFPGVAGFGIPDKPDFWIRAAGADEGTRGPVHVAFASPDRATVDAFYQAAIAAGGKDNGAPGPRPQYHRGYYGAFVIDPDGNNVEAVCHRL
jgi:catechol 2,3-dioxygenase-like lactoylglutathione lyase family enzyme